MSLAEHAASGFYIHTFAIAPERGLEILPPEHVLLERPLDR
jgi:hypothetical protein